MGNIITFEPVQEAGTPTPSSPKPITAPITIDGIDDILYGGTIDLDTGILSKTWSGKTFDSRASWRTTPTVSVFNREFGELLLYSESRENIKCDCLYPVNKDRISRTSYCIATNTGTTIAIRISSSIETLNELDEWLKKHNITVVHRIKTPTVYQLTPSQLNQAIHQLGVKTPSAIELRNRIIIAQPHIENLSGSGIVTFETDVPANLKKCKIHFSPVQEGEGDPSPDNVRPITGWDGAEVKINGKNLFSFDNVKRKQIYKANMKPIDDSPNDLWLSGATGASNDQILTVNAWGFCALYLNWKKCDRDVVVTMSCKVINYTEDCAGNVSLCYEDRYGNLILPPYVTFNTVGEHSVVQTVTIPANCLPVFRATPANKGTSVTLTQFAEIHDLMFELGSEQTSYEPYIETKITIPFPKTIYGGYVDLVNGEAVLTVNRWMDDLSTLDFTTRYTGNVNKTLSFNLSKAEKYGYVSEIIAENYTYVRTAAGVPTKPDNYDVGLQPYRSNGSSWTGGSTTIYLILQKDESPSGKVVYHLKDELTYNLGPIETIKTLKGNNNILSNANDEVEVTYWKH